MNNRNRRPRPSVFFILFKAALKALAVIVFTLFLELWFNQLFSIWKQSLRYELLWFLPLIFGLGVFLDSLCRKNWMSIMIWSGISASLVFAMASVYMHPPAQVIQLGMLRSHALEKAAQNQKPSIASTLRQPLCEIPLYFEHLDGQPVLGEADQSAIAHMINSFPEELKHRAAGVYFLGRDSFNTLHDYGPADEIAGFTEMASATIVIKVRQDEADRYQALRKDGQTVSLNDPLCYQETLIHEFTHLLDVRPTGKTPCLSQREDWLDLYTRYQSLLGDYAMSAPTEYFAETGVFYFLYPHLLQKICPELYGWFDANALNPQGRITLDSGLFCFLGPCREMRKDEKQNGQERAGGAWGRRKKNESGYHPDSKKGSRKK